MAKHTKGRRNLLEFLGRCAALSLGSRLTLAWFIAFLSWGVEAGFVHAGEFKMNVRKVLELPTRGTAVAVVWSPDGATLAAASDFGNVLTVWDSNTGKVIDQIWREGGGPSVGGSIAFLRGASQLLFLPPSKTDNSIALSIWDVKSGKIVGTVAGPQPGEDYSRNRTEVFQTSADQRILAAGGHAEKPDLIVYKTDDWSVVKLAATLEGIQSLVITPDGRFVAVGGPSGTIEIFDLANSNKNHVLRIFEKSKFGWINADPIAISPNGDMALAGGKVVGIAGAYATSPDAFRWEAEVDTVRIMRVEDGVIVARFKTGPTSAQGAVWDPQNRYVAFGDDRTGLLIWQTPFSDRQPKRVEVPSRIFTIAVSPDGGRLAIATANGVVIYAVD